MTSTAISAQNSTFQIETGTGGAKTITAITVGYPAIVTATAHGLSNGDVVTIAGVVGTMSTLNGTTRVVANKTTNTFALLDFDSTGLTYTSGGTATPVTYTTVANVKSYNGFDGASSEIDVTNLSSTAKEKRLGLQDFGKFSIELDPDFADAGQLAMRAAKAAGTQKNFKWNYPNGKVASFAAYVKSMPEQGGVDAVISGSAEMTITGAVTVA
jgi:hypothetical protein